MSGNAPKADAWNSKLNGKAKKQKNRHERRKAKKDPETLPSYGRYDGYLS